MQALNRSARSLGLLLGLLAIFFALLSFQANRARTLDTARGAVLTVVSPLQRLVALVSGGVDGATTGLSELYGAAERAERLEGQVRELRRELRELQEAGAENRRLRALLDLRERIAADGMAARIIGRDLAHRFESVTVDRGSMDGVADDAPVLSPDGALVGRVVELGPWTSIVQLLTGPLSGVGARLVASRATGLAAGSDGPVLELRYVDTEIPVERGERVITSGEDGIYPPGIEIGTVGSVSAGAPVPGTPRIPLTREETALFWEIQVIPSADVTRLEDVLVLPGVDPSRDLEETEEPAGEATGEDGVEATGEDGAEATGAQQDGSGVTGGDGRQDEEATGGPGDPGGEAP